MTVLFSLSALSDNHNHSTWLTISLLLMFVVYAFMARFRGALWLEYQRSFWQSSALGDRNLQDSKGLVLFALLQVAIFIYLLLPKINPEFGSNFLLFVVSILALLCFYILQLLLLYLFTFVIDKKALAPQFDAFKTLGLQVLTLPLIVINLLLYSSHGNGLWIMVAAALLLFTVVALVYFSRLVKLGLKQHLTWWSIILYFCGLEIVPVAVLGKALLNYQ